MMQDVREGHDHLAIWIHPNIKRALDNHFSINEGFRLHCLTNRANRVSPWSSKYTGGSATFIKTKSRLLLECEATLAETFKYTHLLKANKERFANERFAAHYFEILGSFFASGLHTSTLAASFGSASATSAANPKEVVDLREQLPNPHTTHTSTHSQRTNSPHSARARTHTPEEERERIREDRAREGGNRPAHRRRTARDRRLTTSAVASLFAPSPRRPCEREGDTKERRPRVAIHEAIDTGLLSHREEKESRRPAASPPVKLLLSVPPSSLRGGGRRCAYGRRRLVLLPPHYAPLSRLQRSKSPELHATSAGKGFKVLVSVLLDSGKVFDAA
ncbi:hypothetical protein Ahy_B02g061095 [Arachis hypogaea]|uniref:Uncharacterized protein n=1 Tax=Arachis hypogaea TaxID=3818 RepID=A0A445AK13_ARAHY|nr:hypothetical protein Ahy_B02g061095 [Arachis hypogaea]